jgi:hypothetical protein
VAFVSIFTANDVRQEHLRSIETLSH